ncbi:MAG: HAMP domain-containing sensor histidine kinase [Bacteroidota bacterium]
MFKQFEWRILFRVFLLCLTLFVAAWLILTSRVIFIVVLSPLIIYQLVDFYKFHKKAHDELAQFVESVHYRDFSRYFDVKHAPPDLQPLREGFNEINTTFKDISKERETQYQYLQKILELVNTGILSYEEQSGEVIWMNESLKRMLQLPYLKTIHSMARRDNELYEHVIALRPGEGKIATIHLDKNSFKVLLAVTTFQTDGKKFKLIAFQNVNEALDETESKAWQKLLSVMTHEIMNSVAPISSLADTLVRRLQETIEKAGDDAGDLEDLELGIDTIRRRSEGLLRFAETYRNLNKITSLNLKRVYVRELFGNLHQLMHPTLRQKNIELEIILKETDLQLDLDVNLIEQVLINLLVNAMEAVKETENPKIGLSAATGSNNKVLIYIKDNGTGMSEDLLDKIFVPFFTTRKNGSGIGLSLCKQIMLLHHGNIKVQSVKGKGTEFTLVFTGL